MSQQSNLSFTPDQRVRLAADHGRVWKTGKRYYIGPIIVVCARRDADLVSNPARMGMAISKKVLRRAVDRNRVKRLMRESFRHNAARLPAVDVVLSLSQRNRMRDEASLLRALEKTWATLSAC